MKIKNKYIKIKNGKKEFILHNYIYDKYLKLFIDNQLTNDEIDRQMSNVYIKFENTIENYMDAEREDFDIRILYNHLAVNGSENKVISTYYYNTTGTIREPTSVTPVDIENYYDKKITAIGFGSAGEIYACVDTNNYNIYLYEEENFHIIREDIMSSDAICRGTNYPLHLSPYLGMHDRFNDLRVKLYSVGLGFAINEINIEYILGDSINAIRESDTSYGFNLKKGENYELHPNTTVYCGNSKYPTEIYKEKEFQPNINIYPSTSKYPMQSNYKYIIYKYEIYYYDVNTFQYVNVGYYTMNVINETKGLFEIITKIERS